MMDLGPHASFIVAAYIATFAIVGVLMAWLAYDGRVQRQRIADLEARGVRRRSATAKPSPT